MKQKSTLALAAVIGLAALVALAATWCSKDDVGAERASAGAGSGGTRPAPSPPFESLPRNLREKMLLEADNVPIQFYGRMVDQDGNPLAGVNITYGITKAPVALWTNNLYENGNCLSGPDGVFVINADGKGLAIGKMGKSGYRIPANGMREFSYGPSVSPSSRHHPDPSRPVELLLVRADLPKAESIPIQERLSFAWNVSPIALPLVPKVGTLTLVPTRSIPAPGGTTRSGFDWSVELRCAGFGLIPRPHGDNTARAAPESGYQSVIRYGSLGNSNPWQSFPKTTFFFKTTTGMYGEMELILYVDRADNRPANGTIHAWLNQSGGRNVDHDP